MRSVCGNREDLIFVVLYVRRKRKSRKGGARKGGGEGGSGEGLGPEDSPTRHCRGRGPRRR